MPAARYFFNSKTFHYRLSLSEQEEPALLLELCIHPIVLQLLRPRPSCSLQRKVVPNGSDIAQVQHLSKSSNIQRHFSPSHPR
jgi:hypothetical protein